MILHPSIDRRPGADRDMPAGRHDGAATIAGAASAFCANCWWALLRLCRRRRAVVHLNELDDRMLEDIGIGRSQIRSVVGGPDRDPSGMDRG